MKRELMGLEVKQDSKDKMFSATDISKVGNMHRASKGGSLKQMAHYFNQKSTKELINAICLEENLQQKEVKKVVHKGECKGTWVHPIMFVDMVMWYSPDLKVKIIKWVIDGLLSARNESGDSFNEMTRILTQHFPKEFNKPITYSRIANQISRACMVGSAKDKWQQASEQQLKLRDRIQENVCLLADMSPNAGSCISKAIEKAIQKERLNIK